MAFLGTEFKTIACPITGVMRHMEVQHGKEGMKDDLYHRQYGATAGCTVCLLENSIPQGHRNIHHGI